jgi:hypothetical protein
MKLFFPRVSNGSIFNSNPAKMPAKKNLIVKILFRSYKMFVCTKRTDVTKYSIA